MSKIVLTWIDLIVSPFASPQQVPTTPVAPTATSGRRDTVHRVDPGWMYHRVYARVPLVGTGKQGDPIRPMFAPIPQTASTQKPSPTAVPHSGILGYTMIISDDGKWALCEFVGATPQDLAVITSAASASVVVFPLIRSGHADVARSATECKSGSPRR
jgi:hypothetical protein